MNYQETLAFMYAQLPMFHRVGADAYKPSLDNTLALCEALGNPQHQFKSVHIAGTNGKGSSSHFLASILQSSGYKTGLYTSPHLKDFRERIKINGEMIAELGVVDFIEENKTIIEKIQPSFFELCVAMAFHHFAKEKIDIAIIEVGMGGRLDSTNIINPLVSLITNISFDHVQFLGNTIPLIAREKAGIIKPNTPVIISQTQEECKEVFIDIAKENNASILFADQEYQIHKVDHAAISTAKFEVDHQEEQYEIESSLTGTYQEKNLAGVLACVNVLRLKGYTISHSNLLTGLASVKEQTGLRGRWDCLQTEPLVIADTGHNEDGIKEVLHQLKFLNYDKLHWVWGMVNDKDPSKVFPILPVDATYYFCKPDIPRGLNAEECRKLAQSYHLEGFSYESVQFAYASALKNAKKDDLILIGGSTFVVAEVV